MTRFYLRVGASLVALSGSAALYADSIRFVKDIWQGQSTSSTTFVAGVSTPGRVYFSAKAGIWSSDGTASGTRPVSHDEPGRISITGFSGVGLAGERLITSATFNLFSREPAALNPDDGSVELLRDIALGADSGVPASFRTVGGLVYFWARDEEHGGEIWCSDGTPAGTRIAGEIVPGPGSLASFLDVRNGIAVGDRLLVFPDSSATGPEPWLIDGVAGTATFVGDINPGSFGSISPPPNAVLNGSALLILNIGQGMKQLWAVHASGQSNPIGAPFNQLAASASPVVVGEFAYMVIDFLLYRTDGTPDSLEPVDIDPQVHPVKPLFSANGRLIFSANSAGARVELWSLDAASGALQRIATGMRNNAAQLAAGAALTWFAASTSESGMELWRTDGTADGTLLLRDIMPGSGDSSPELIGTLASQLLFSADDGVHGRELWVSDGTAAGTDIVADLTQPGAASSSPGAGFPVGDGVVFTASDAATGIEPFFSDGTAEGTRLVGDINPGPSSSVQSNPFVGALANGVLAVLNDGTHGPEIWTTDGTPAGTQLVRDINPSSVGTGPIGFTPYGNGYAFLGGSGANDLWATDGTEAGTQRLIDIPSGSGTFGGNRPVLMLDEDALFSVTALGLGHELFRGNLASGVTTIVSDIAPGPDSSQPRLLTELNSDVLFIASSPDAGDELRRMNPSTFSVSLLIDINPGPSGSKITALKRLGGKLVFAADDGAHGMELWSTDGTPRGTVMLADIWAGPQGSSPDLGDALHGLLFFTAVTPEVGRELWVTDGTQEGTWMVRDIFPGTASSDPSGVTAFGDAVYFAARDSLAGMELWRSNGTALGTVRVADIAPGPEDSWPTSIVVSGEQLFISAGTPALGRELWVVRHEESPDLDGDGRVGLQDLAMMLGTFGSCTGDEAYSASADLNESGCVDLQDLTALLASFGT